MVKMAKRLVALAVSVLLVVGLFAGCAVQKGSGSDATTEATTTQAESAKGIVHISYFTGAQEIVDLVNTVINKFNEENPGIYVSQEYQKEASNVIKVKFAAGDAPDIMNIGVEQAYADQGKYLDLGGEDAWWSRLAPSMKELCTDIKSGKQYKINTTFTMAGFFYNKAIFNELGLKEATTWTEFVENLKTIKAKKPDVTPWFIPGKEAWSLGHLLQFLPQGYLKTKYGAIEAKKAMLSNDQSKLDFGTPGGSMETFAKNMLELQQLGLVNSDAVTATYDNHVQALATGKAAIISQGMWVLGGLLTANPDLGKDLGFSPYPGYMEGMKPVILSSPDMGYSVSAESKNTAEAKKFLDYLFNAENQKLLCEARKAPSAFTDVNADWGILKDEVKGALERGVNILFTDEWPAGLTGDDAGKMVQDLLAGKYASSAEFAQAFKDAWDKGIK